MRSSATYLKRTLIALIAQATAASAPMPLAPGSCCDDDELGIGAMKILVIGQRSVDIIAV